MGNAKSTIPPNILSQKDLNYFVDFTIICGLRRVYRNKKRGSQLCRTGSPLQGRDTSKEEPTLYRELPSLFVVPSEIATFPGHELKSSFNIL